MTTFAPKPRLRGASAAFALLFCSSCATLPPAKSPAEALYRKRCGNCHELALPADYSRRDWQRIMSQMSINAGLTEDQAVALLRWVKANSRDAAP